MILAALLAITGTAEAGREPVLKQVDLPHSYYWRELYIPQLTTGPSSVSFTPDGGALIYSMARFAMAAGDRVRRGGRADARRAAPMTISPTSRPTGKASCSADTTATRSSCGGSILQAAASSR